MPISNIQLGCALHRRGYPCEEDLSHGRRHSKKAAALPKGMPQPFFRNKKSQAPYLQTLVLSHI